LISQNLQITLDALANAMDSVASRKGRSIDELEFDALLCRTGSSMWKAPLDTLSHLAEEKSANALRTAYEMAFQAVFGALSKEPHMFPVLLQRDHVWLRAAAVKLFTPENARSIAPFLANCSDDGISAFIEFLGDRTPHAVKYHRERDATYDEIEGLQVMLDRLVELKDKETSLRNLSIQNSVERIRFAVEEFQKKAA
jgi:hypothetical protein